jgi:hypothetical protein
MQAQNVSAHYQMGSQGKKEEEAGRQLFFTACNLLDPWVGDLTSSLEGGLQGGPYTAPSNLCSGVNVALGWVSDRVGVSKFLFGIVKKTRCTSNQLITFSNEHSFNCQVGGLLCGHEILDLT